MNTLSEMFRKFLDNVNAGKVVTDVGPGLALTVPVLMLVSLLTGTLLMPAERGHQRAAPERLLQAERAAELTHLNVLTTTVPELGSQALLPLTEKPVDTQSPDTDVENRAQRCMKAIRREIEIRQASSDPEAARKGATDLKRLELRIEQLDAGRTRVAQLRRDLEKLAADQAPELELEKNLTVWTSNIAATMGLAVVFGVIISQACHLLFFKGLFPLILRLAGWPKKHRVHAVDGRKMAALKAQDPAVAEAHRKLVGDYFRYAEGSVNMAVPVLMLALVLPAYSVRLGSAAHPWTARVVTAGYVLAALLLASGFISFRQFRKKEAAAFPAAAPAS